MKVMDTELYKFAITTEAQFKWVNGELCLSKAIKMSPQIRCATQNKWCRDKVYETLMRSRPKRDQELALGQAISKDTEKYPSSPT